MPELYQVQEYHRQELDRHKENAARLAFAYGDFVSTGQGSVENEKRIDFGLTFIEKPYVTYGAELDLEDLDDQLGKESEDNGMPALPVTQGYVTEWDRDDRDFYIGCWVAARVYFPPIPAVDTDVMVRVTHHFSFSAIAMKDVPVAPPSGAED
jgi:hypothetical protein